MLQWHCAQSALQNQLSDLPICRARACVCHCHVSTRVQTSPVTMPIPQAPIHTYVGHVSSQNGFSRTVRGCSFRERRSANPVSPSWMGTKLWLITLGCASFRWTLKIVLKRIIWFLIWNWNILAKCFGGNIVCNYVSLREHEIPAKNNFFFAQACALL